MTTAQASPPNIVLILADNLGWGELGLLRRRRAARRADAAHRRARRRRAAAHQLQRRERLRADALGADDRTPSDPHRRAAVGAGRTAARHHPVGDHARAAASRAGLRDRLLRQVASRRPRGPLSRPTAASTSGTASRAPPTRACSPARPATIPRSCRCRTSWKARKGEPASERRTSTTWTRAGASTRELVARTHRFHAHGKRRRTSRSSPTCRSRSCIIRRCRTAISPAAPAPAISPIRWRRWTTASARCSMRSTRCGLPDDTLFIFAQRQRARIPPARGAAPPARGRGTYHTSMEGALRVPFMMRWPGKIAAGRVTNEIVHVTDLYPTLARVAGAQMPADRPIDGVDQLDFFCGRQAQSNREGFVYYIKQELRAAKWRDWKMHIVWEPEPNAGPNHLETPLALQPDARSQGRDRRRHRARAGCARPLRRMIHAFPGKPASSIRRFRPARRTISCRRRHKGVSTMA